MNVKRLRRKCSVRGCGNTGSYVISRTREMGYSVIICRECLEQGLKAVKELETHAQRPTENEPEPEEKETSIQSGDSPPESNAETEKAKPRVSRSRRNGGDRS